MKKRTWMVLSIAVYFGIVVSWVVTAEGAGQFGRDQSIIKPKTLKERQVAPDFQLKDLNGQPLSLSDSKGKVVLLDFWATWCPPCVAEIPHFKELYAQYKDKGFEIIGVSLDQEGVKVVGPFAKKNAIQYPIVIGNDQVTRSYGGIRGIPTTFLIDRKGKIAQKYVGYHDKKVFEESIVLLLAER